MKKILLIVDGNITGLQYHRQLVPHKYLADNYKEYFKISQVLLANYDDFDKIPDEKIKEYHAVSFLRNISIVGKTKQYIQKCHNLGVKVFFDTDDYWFISNDHLLYKTYNEWNITNQTIDALKYSDYVFTTTPFLRKKILPYNQNVFVIPNGIDENLPQFRKREIKNRRVRFGWVGAMHHLKYINLLKNDISKIYNNKTLLNDIQLCVGGWNKNPEYLAIEKIFTNNYDLKEEYKKYLFCYTKNAEHICIDQPYRRLHGTDCFNYAKIYNDLDVCLVPITNDSFSASKSTLKIIEAGFMKKAVIVNEELPYILDIRNNCLVTNKKNSWYDNIKLLTYNKELRSELSEKLYSYVKENYSMEKLCKLRAQIYSHILS